MILFTTIYSVENKVRRPRCRARSPPRRPGASAVRNPRSAILEQLRAQPEPVTQAALVTIHRAPRQHGARAPRRPGPARGLVRRSARGAEGRGRPAWLYEATEGTGGRAEYAGLAAALASSLARTSEQPGEDAPVAGEESGHELVRDRGGLAVRTRGPPGGQVVEGLDELGFAARGGPKTRPACGWAGAASSRPPTGTPTSCAGCTGVVRGALQEYGADPAGADLVTVRGAWRVPPRGPAPPRSPARQKAHGRGFWPMRDLPVVGWLLARARRRARAPLPARAALAADPPAAARRGDPLDPGVEPLLRRRPAAHADRTRRPARRTSGWSCSTSACSLVASACSSTLWAVTVAGAAAVAVAVGWHGVALVAQLRAALPARFAHDVRYYVAAGGLLPVGADARRDPGPRSSRPAAHSAAARARAVNLLGWIGLTVAGHPGHALADDAAHPDRRRRRAAPRGAPCPCCSAGIRAGRRRRWPDSTPGQRARAAGVPRRARPAGRAFVRTARRKPPASFPTWSCSAAAVVWLVGCLRRAWSSACRDRRLVGRRSTPGSRGSPRTWPRASGPRSCSARCPTWCPVALGGGPAAVRAARRPGPGGALRVVPANVRPARLRAAGAEPRAGRCARRSSWSRWRRSCRCCSSRSAPSAAVRRRAATTAPAATTPGLAAVAGGPRLAVVVLAVAVGVAARPGRPRPSARAGRRRGRADRHTTTVQVEAADMRFTPVRSRCRPATGW